MQLSRDINIKVNGCFIIGLPGETLDSADYNWYAKTLMPNTAQFYPHMLYPGQKGPNGPNGKVSVSQRLG